MVSNAIEVTGLSDALIEAENSLRNEALREAGLVDEFNDDTDLVFPLPEGAVLTKILQSYDTRNTTRKKVRCSACKQHQAHNRGFRVQLGNGQVARIGFNCGENYFGDGAWERAKRDFERREENVQYVARIEPAKNAIEIVVPLIHDWHERTKDYAVWMKTFREDVPELYRRLVEVSKKSDGRLERDRYVKRTRVNRNGREETVNVVEPTKVGQIPFPAMFRGATPNNELNGALQKIGLAVALLENRRDTRSLARAFSYLREARQFLMEADKIHAGIAKSLSHDWLKPLCDWASRDDGLSSQYSFDGNAIIHDEMSRVSQFQFYEAEKLGKTGLRKILEAWPS